METLIQSLKTTLAGPVLDAGIPFAMYKPIDLSVFNRELAAINIANPDACQQYIEKTLAIQNGQIAYGGYLEQRNLYDQNVNFSASEEEWRTIHLGIDFWAPAGTSVRCPLQGTVHSFRNNDTKGDYGPTIILEHRIDAHTFYSLYGHLSLESLKGLFEGKEYRAGEPLATLGTPDINVNYAPHLHFQLIVDLQGYKGDYPGVSSPKDLPFYQKNCPDPNILLKL